ncbi:MAG: GDP-L-fucose synthase [Sorangiineae bacterium]|nr:GDP-L-fucose synthase [Polyangiaceae bacterium]MEB2324010.1 GDP-L-fucose synthase [Sorangiineae bacterium]
MSVDWAKTRVVVTGGAGFLGSFVVEALERRGAREIVVPRSKDYDLVDGDAVRRLLADVKPELVFHLAARVGGIGANRENPGRFFYENAMMGIQLIHESWRAGVKKLVCVGTVCAYPKFCPTPFKEEDLWNGYPEETNAPYGIAKKVMGVQSAGYREQYGFDSIVLYPVNLYGPRDNFDLRTSHVIPAMLRKFAEAKREGRAEVALWGDGSPTREFFYVEDCAEGLVLAAERYDSSEPVNLGSGEEISIRLLAEKIARLVGYSGRVTWDTTQPNGQPRRRLEVSRARERFGFEAQVGLDQGLARTWEWMQAQER